MIKPVHIDGWLYYGIAVSGALQTSLTQDTVKAILPDPWLTILIVVNGSFIMAGLTALKTFRSTSYAVHKANGQETEKESVPPV